MTRRRRVLHALLCAGAIAANGTGALAQTGQRRERAPQDEDALKRAAEVLVQQDRIMVDQHAGPLPGGMVIAAQGGGGVDFTFVANEMSFDHKVVKGAPFSADAVTESVQTLGDGNRITRKTNARMFRDSEGRTRREQTLNGIGPWASTGEAPQTVFINDPVGGTNYVLNSRDKTAQKLTHFVFRREETSAAAAGRGGTTLIATTRGDAGKPPIHIQGGNLGGKAVNKVQPVYPPVAKAAGADGTVRVEVTIDEQGAVSAAQAVAGHPLLRQSAVEAARQWTFTPTQLENKPVKVRGFISFDFLLDKQEKEGQARASSATFETPHGTPVKRERVPFETKLPKYPEAKESLGRQQVEGVEAEGTRTTVTIPAGAIGNDRPILIVSERWYSAELQQVVMTRHSDPRFGETTYRLTNINRNEPDRSLFEVPSDYTVKESPVRGAMPSRMILREQKEQ